MVGVKTWEDEQITLILTCKAQGKSVSEIIRLLKARWPRKLVKDSGVRYVMTNYKDFQEVPQSKSMADNSNSRSSQAGRTSPQRRPNHKQAKPTSRRTLPPPAVNHRTQIRIYSPPPDPLPVMDQHSLASQMRQVSGGPITASLDIAQPFNLLNGPVHSRTKLLAHAEQAQNIGVYAIQRGQAVPPSSPGAKSIMASPTPTAPTITSEAQPTMPGGFQENNMQRTVSMPSNFQYNPHEQMQPQNMQMYNQQGQTGPGGQMGGQQWPQGPQNMPMNGQQQYQMPHMFNPQHTFPRTPNFGGYSAHHQGIAQNSFFQQGQPGGFVPYGGAGTFDGLPGMPYIPSAYNPYGGLPQPATPRQIYQHQVNQFGPSKGMMAPSPAPMMQNNGAQVPQLQRPASQISNIDPELRNATPSTGAQSINHAAIAGVSGPRPPTRNGVSAIPQQNHDMGRQHLSGQNITSGLNNTGSSNNQGPGSEPSLAAAHSSGSRQPTVQQAQMGPIATLHANQPALQPTQGPRRGQALKLQRDNFSQGALEGLPNVANSTPRAGQCAHPQFEGHLNGPKVDRNSLNGQSGQSPAKIVTIMLREPTFETPFEFPTSHRAWYSHISEQSKKMSQQPAENLKFSVLSGHYEYVFWKPIFKAGVKFSDGVDWEPKRVNSATQALGACSTPGSKCSSPNCFGCQLAASNATPAATKEPAQKQLNTNPKTPPPRGTTSSTTEVTPAVSSMNLKSGQDTPAAKTSAQPESSKGGSNRMDIQNSSNASSNNRASGKRAAPAAEQGESPSKRRKGPAQTPTVTKALTPPFLKTREIFDGQVEFAPPISLAEAFPSFFSKANERPVLNLQVQNIPLDASIRRNSRGVSSVPPFNPRPSQPLKSSSLFNSPGKRYSAGVTQMQQSMTKKLANADLSQGNASTKPSPTGEPTPQKPGFPLIQNGTPTSPQTQQAQNPDANNHHHHFQENQSPGSPNEDFAPPEHEQQVYDDGALFGSSDNGPTDGFMNQTLDNTDLDAILAGTDIAPPDFASGGPSGDEIPSLDSNTSLSPDDNPDPPSATPASPPQNYFTGLSPVSDFFDDATYHWKTYTDEPERPEPIMNGFGQNLS